MRHFTATGLVLQLMRAKAKGELDRTIADVAMLAIDGTMVSRRRRAA